MRVGVLTFCSATEPEMDELIQWMGGGGRLGVDATDCIQSEQSEGVGNCFTLHIRSNIKSSLGFEGMLMVDQ